MTPEEVIRDINGVIRRTIEAGLSDHQNYPAMRDVGQNQREIYIEGAPDLSASMKDKPYEEVYGELEAGRAYHIKMVDGALVQMCYTFERRSILSHRLCVFPSPVLEQYATAADYYDADELFADVVGRFKVRVPLRFDYSASDEEHIDVEHPKSHLTLGEYKGCRIPVSGPLTPKRFMRFVLRNFYNPAYPRINIDDAALHSRFDDAITAGERRIAYLTI